MRILIVEDDRDLSAALEDALRYEGYQTVTAFTGTEALAALGSAADGPTGGIDLVLLDRDLPVLSGDAVMATIAAQRLDVAVIMLTAAAEVGDRVSGLDLGADDYLTKPFAYPELLARIRAAERRGLRAGGRAASVLTHGPIQVDTVRRLAFTDGGRRLLKLTPKEYGVLAALVAAGGGYVGVDELFDDVWGSSDAEHGDVVKTTVYALRRKLGDPGLIESTRGEGYRLA